MIIGCTSKASGGKDTFANIACNEYGFIRADFSDTLKGQLKEEFLNLFDIKYEDRNLYGTQADKEEELFCSNKYIYPKWFYKFITKINSCRYYYDNYYFNMRSLMQYYGTEVFREIDENYWVNKTLNNLDIDKNYVCASVRFLNEAKAIKDKGGYIVKINRSNLFNISNPNHISEKELELIEADYTIDNNGTLEEYHQKCRNCIELILRNTND